MLHREASLIQTTYMVRRRGCNRFWRFAFLPNRHRMFAPKNGFWLLAFDRARGAKTIRFLLSLWIDVSSLRICLQLVFTLFDVQNRGRAVTAFSPAVSVDLRCLRLDYSRNMYILYVEQFCVHPE